MTVYEWGVVAIIVIGCFTLILRGLNGNASHILTAIVSYLFGRGGTGGRSSSNKKKKE